MSKGIIVFFKRFFLIIFIFLINIANVLAEEARVNFSITLSEYLKIETVTSPVLVANITDDTGNLYAPLSTRFRVISNNTEEKPLYLKAEAITENGNESAMFEHGGRVYVAFTNVTKAPRSEALYNCKIGAHPKFSPGVVAYPVTSIVGTKSKYQHGKGNYKVFVGNGETNILVNIGSHVLRNSFDKNDPFGFYQATLSLTESDI